MVSLVRIEENETLKVLSNCLVSVRFPFYSNEVSKQNTWTYNYTTGTPTKAIRLVRYSTVRFLRSKQSGASEVCKLKYIHYNQRMQIQFSIEKEIGTDHYNQVKRSEL